jgi:iron complex outermembrane receptor protein
MFLGAGRFGWRRASIEDARAENTVQSRRIAKVVSGLLFSAFLFSSGHALADARTEARARFRKGMEAILNGRYEEGIPELQRAYEILPHPNVLFNIARAYAEAGDLDNAILHYRKYLDTNPKDRDEVLQIVANLESRLRRQQAAAQAAQQSSGQQQPATGVAAQTTPTTTQTPVGSAGVTPSTVPQTGMGTPGPDQTTPQPRLDASGVKTEDVFAETVVTASRGAQSPLEAPNSTSIITEQDIRLSGITKIPELLRRFAGLDIMQITGAQTEVGIRGFNQRLSNRVLVLVNGRSVYVDLLGATLWPALSVGVEDIERIEVVRGPGSALYGADAFNGVINIITKAPGEGTSGINVGYGDHDTTHGSLWATGRDRDFAWRAAAGYDYLPRWSRDVSNTRRDLRLGVDDQNASQRTVRMDLRGTQQIGKDVVVGIGGGLVRGDFETLGIGPLNNIAINEWHTSDVTVYVNAPYIQARAFWNRFSGAPRLNSNYIGQSMFASPRAAQNVIDGEVQFVNQFETGKGIRHDLHLGVSYRYKDVEWSYNRGFRVEHHRAAFFHDEIKLGERFAIIGDYRLDYVPYLQKVIQSPRGSVLFHPTKESTLRAVVATAFRKPTFLESYVDFPFQLPQAGAVFQVQGERDDDPRYKVQQEKVFTAELGYLNQESDYFVVDSAVYFNQVSDLIQISAPRQLLVSDIPGGLAQPRPEFALYPVLYGGFDNQCQRYNLYGGEVGVRTFPTEGLDLYANYTLNKVVQDNSRCPSPQEVVVDQRTPMHKVNLGVQVRTRPGIDGEVDFHYVSSQTWAEQVADIQDQTVEYRGFAVDAYTLLNARVGYRFLRNQADVSVMSYNLLGTEHRQHPFGQLVGRRVMAFFTYRF